ncbi:MAG TPA: DUF1343 domain-containing protein [Gemmatimonadaceae bacterium]|nr:DUF1343 domain-containing protein [Gemmatimonadaceae bacterium]
MNPRSALTRLMLAAVIVAAAAAACTTSPSGEARASEPLAFTDTLAQPQVSLGITTLLSDSLHLVRGRRVGLITNHTGRDEHGTSTIDLLHRAPDVQLTALFSPEHGIRGVAEAGERVASGIDSATGVPIHSLYGDTRIPGPRTLENVDVLLYDIQDVGARMYTYVWTMTLAAEAAKRAGKQLIVLDRPNPIRADIIEGGFIEQRYRSFTGLHNVTLRYGLTPGELALYLAGTGQIDADIVVAPMKGYRLSMWWDETGLEWRNPSPNIRDLDAATLYPGIAFVEATSMSEGRGTEAPFKLVGAPWLTDAGAIAGALNDRRLAGVRFDSTSRTIAAGQKHAGRTIPMIRITVTARDSVRAAEVGAHLLREIYRRHLSDWRWREQGIERLSGTSELRTAVQNGGIEALLEKWRVESARFESLIASYRLYPR